MDMAFKASTVIMAVRADGCTLRLPLQDGRFTSR